MKSRLMRPAALYFPLVGLLTAAFGDASYPEMLLIFYCMIQLFSLCAVDSFRNAAAREPGRRRVDKRFWGSLLPLLLGLGLSLYFTGFHPRSEEPLMGASPMCLAAWLIIIEQLFEERMYAIGKNVDGHLLALLSSLLLFVGMMADCAWVRYSPLRGVGTFCGAALGVLIALVASFIVEPPRGFSLLPRNLGFAPKAALQCLLYPAALCGFFLLEDSIGAYELPGRFAVIPALAGLALWRLSRTVCRRAGDESRPLNLFLMALCAAFAAASLWMPEFVPCAEAMALAMLCVLIVFCAPGWRVYTGAVLVIAANILRIFPLLPEEWTIPAAAACAALAVILNLKKAFMKRV